MSTVYAKSISVSEKRCVLCLVKTTFILGIGFTSYNEKNFLQKKVVFRSSICSVQHPQIGTYATLGRPLHPELGVVFTIAVQKCPFRKLGNKANWCWEKPWSGRQDYLYDLRLC